MMPGARCAIAWRRAPAVVAISSRSRPELDAFHHASRFFDPLKQRPGAGAERLGQGFETAGAGGGIGDPCEIGLMKEQQLRVARDAAGEGVGQAEREGERKKRDRVGAAEAGGKRGSRRAQDICPRIMLRHHPEGGFGMEPDRFRRKAAKALDPRPEAAKGAELREGQKFVGVGGEKKRDFVAGLLQ